MPPLPASWSTMWICGLRTSTRIATACTATTTGMGIEIRAPTRISPTDMRTRKRVSNMTKTIAFAAAISAFLMVQAMGGFAQETGSPTPNTAPPLRIGSGDLLEISVFDSPELSGRFRVDEKGDISAPLIGPVRVEGKTAVEAGEAVQQHYVDADILKPTKAHATVFISEYA